MARLGVGEMLITSTSPSLPAIEMARAAASEAHMPAKPRPAMTIFCDMMFLLLSPDVRGGSSRGRRQASGKCFEIAACKGLVVRDQSPDLRQRPVRKIGIPHQSDLFVGRRSSGDAQLDAVAAQRLEPVIRQAV